MEPMNTKPMLSSTQLNINNTQTSADYQAGQLLYQQHPCAECHDSASQQTAIPLKGLSTRYDLASLQQLLQTPTPPMPSFSLSSDQRRQLATYLLIKH